VSFIKFQEVFATIKDFFERMREISLEEIKDFVAIISSKRLFVSFKICEISKEIF
jgi:hypothetical protein